MARILLLIHRFKFIQRSVCWVWTKEATEQMLPSDLVEVIIKIFMVSSMVDCCGILAWQITTDIIHLSSSLSGPFLIHDLLLGRGRHNPKSLTCQRFIKLLHILASIKCWSPKTWTQDKICYGVNLRSCTGSLIIKMNIGEVRHLFFRSTFNKK
jgi:hypothetical protein